MSTGPPLTTRQAEIADAVLRIIGSRGIAALTTKVLAEELGVSQGAPFRHFASLDDMLDGVSVRVEEVILATFPDPDLPPLDRIRALFSARVDAVGRKAGIARLMFSEQFAMALPAQAGRRLRRLIAATRSFRQEALEAAVALGQVRSDVEPAQLLPILFGTLQNLVFAQALGKSHIGVNADSSCDALFLLLRPVPLRAAGASKPHPSSKEKP